MLVKDFLASGGTIRPDLIINLSDIKTQESIATEAVQVQQVTGKGSMADRSLNPSMQVQLLTDRTIVAGNLRRVTNPHPFMSGDIPTEDGLFSLEIFGASADKQRRVCGYIDLHGKFFHPFVYEILCQLNMNTFKKCAQGIGSWVITPEGVLTEVKDKDSPLYNEENSGNQWLVKNYSKLNFKRNSSNARNDRITLLESLKPEEVFITKWLVIPRFYRDVDFSNGQRKIPEINNMYTDLIRYSNGLDDPFNFFSNALYYNIQTTLVDIRKYAQKLIEKKRGFFHRAILGKNTDRGSRDVISVPTMNHFERPDDNPIDVFHTGIPVGKCLVMGYNFIMRYCLNFFANNFRNVKTYGVWQKNDNGGYDVIGTVAIRPPTETYTSDEIQKQMDRFIHSPMTRFDPIMLEAVETGSDGKPKRIPMHFSGLLQNMRGFNESSVPNRIVNRPLTWTDLFYMAAVDTLSDKWLYLTRYPVEDYSHIFPSLCTPVSTLKTIPVEIEGRVYNNYPLIDPELSAEEVSTQFIDTVTMSNLHLKALGGDYDGDTSSEKLCFTLEANAEAAKLATDLKSFISPDGQLLKLLANESSQCLYSMTVVDPNHKVRVSPEKKKELLSLTKDQMSISLITKLFSNRTTLSSKKTFATMAPYLNIKDKLTLKKGEYINNSDVETTVGIFLFNKLIVEGNLESVVPGHYYNHELTKKQFSKFLALVANGLTSGKISVIPNGYRFLKDYEFWTMKLVTIFSPSYSMGMIKPSEEMKRMKAKLLEEADGDDLATLAGIREKLVGQAREETKNEAGRSLFESGARGSFDNDFGNMFVAVGPVENQNTGKYDFMTSSYIDGIAKKDLVAAGNIIVNAEYPKAVGTAKGGYIGKQFNAVFQTITLGPRGSDCGTKSAMVTIITKDDIPKWTDQYIVEPNGNLLRITKDLDPKYIGKPVRVRSPMHCLRVEGDAICSKCAGERFYDLDVTSFGLLANILAGQMMRASLKLRHNLMLEVNKIDPNILIH